MEKIKGAVYLICIVSVALTLYKMLSPNGKYKKQMNFTAALVYIVVLLSVFKKIDINLPDNYSNSSNQLDYSGFEEQMYDRFCELTKDRVASALTDKLTKIGISVSKIAVNADITENNSIIITKVACELFDKNQVSEASRIIKKEVDEGADIKITVAD